MDGDVGGALIRSSRVRSVLLVERNPALSASFARVLSRRGYVVEPVEDLGAAVDAAKTLAFDTVLARLEDLAECRSRLDELVACLESPSQVVVSMPNRDASAVAATRDMGVRTLSWAPTASDLLAGVSFHSSM